MEESIRIGNDFTIEWSIFKSDGGLRKPYSLEGKNLKLILLSPFVKKEQQGFYVESNKVVWTFRGKDQKHTGRYSLILIENDGSDGMVTVDKCDAFTLVSHSCQSSEKSNGNISIQTVRLSSEVEIAPVFVGTGGGPVDDEMSDSSENAVQNKTIKAYVDSSKKELLSRIEKIEKAEFDIDENGNLIIIS